ncbi:Hg(II)-responsive transcriptional regulator [Ralstonia mannitolilytica]|uniref:Hg(II)-responsive transcriptional regulator n=1 Tax=Ralstonia mannitolilytica TaxID=105219 RepID=UPI000C7BB200|nr:Hg(II)-responsive transcriptional regulator [Ralstonia mannitolilytica]PLT16052.1 Hg(II)-responsive transcriptional regulator [Ralstonia mannitolilytica]CAJ0885448.1 ISL3 family transposase ISStma11 [Ralstonia mannitolilytica]
MNDISDREPMTIGTLARAAGVNVETIRFYQRKGLMPEPDRPLGSIRRYGGDELGRIRFIKSAQRLGFSLDEVADLLELEDGTHCQQARERGRKKLADVRARIADLKRIETALADLISRCSATRGRVRCPLIDALHEA